MKRILFFTGIITLLTTTGCIFLPGGGRRDRASGQDIYQNNPAIMVELPAIQASAPEFVMHPPEMAVIPPEIVGPVVGVNDN